MPDHFPIVYSFTAEQVKNQQLAGFLALFTEAVLAQRESALALRNSLQLALPSVGRNTARFENEHIRAFCKRLVRQCPVLPWVASLSTPFYREVIYATMGEIHVTYQDQKPGKYAATFGVEEMEEIIGGQVEQISKIGYGAGVSPKVVEERISSLTRYLRDGVDLPAI
jgi:hypothetical protein